MQKPASVEATVRASTEPAAVTSDSECDNVTLRSRPRSNCSCSCISADSIRDIIREELDRKFNNQLTDIQIKLTSFEESIAAFHTQNDILCQDSESQKVLITELQKDNEGLREATSNLTQRLHLLEQLSRTNNIQVQCVPENKTAAPAELRPVPARVNKHSHQTQKNCHVSSPRDTHPAPDAVVSLDTRDTSVANRSNQTLFLSKSEPPTATNDGKNWTEVRHKKSRQSLSLRCVGGPTVTSLKAAESLKHFHLWNMLSELNEIKQYLGEICPDRAVTVLQLRTTNSYNSYKIGVPEDCFEKCFSINIWPENARVKKWINYRQRSPASDGQTFLHGVGVQ